MTKDIERAIQFQQRLWAASGRVWTEEDFDRRWIFVPMGVEWDDWYRQGLAPIPFCAFCGDDQITITYTNPYSLHKVPVNLCSDCYEYAMARFSKVQPDTLGSILIRKLGCLIPILLILGVISLIVFYILK